MWHGGRCSEGTASIILSVLVFAVNFSNKGSVPNQPAPEIPGLPRELAGWGETTASAPTPEPPHLNWADRSKLTG